MHQVCKINVHKTDQLVIIEVLGDLTAAAENAMDAAYQGGCDNNARNILIKFDGKSRINSAGIAIMIDLVIKSQEKGRHIFMSGVSEHFQKIFKLVGLTKYTTIVASEEEIQSV